MKSAERILHLTPGHFFELEDLIEALAGELYINDSYFSGINVAMEQFYQLTFENCTARAARVSVVPGKDGLVIDWQLDQEVYRLVKQSFSGETSAGCEIILKIVDELTFLDDQSTLQFQFMLLNNFEQVYVSRASVLSAYYRKNRVSDTVHHDTF